MFNHLIYKVENSIATITLNRPKFGNAFLLESYIEVKQAACLAGQDDNVRAVVVTGAGKHFSSGGDIVRFKELIDSKKYLPKDGAQLAGAMTEALRDCPKPIVAMVNGAAVGAGAALAMACDFRVMDNTSRLMASFINMGFSADSGLIYFLNAAIGISRTTELLMLPTPIDAQEAYKLGLCNRIAEEGKLLEVTMELAERLANQPTQAIARQKKLLKEFFYSDLHAFNEREAQYMYETGRTQDHAEAVNAFLEKRKPKFIGK